MCATTSARPSTRRWAWIRTGTRMRSSPRPRSSPTDLPDHAGYRPSALAAGAGALQRRQRRSGRRRQRAGDRRHQGLGAAAAVCAFLTLRAGVRTRCRKTRGWSRSIERRRLGKPSRAAPRRYPHAEPEPDGRTMGTEPPGSQPDCAVSSGGFSTGAILWAVKHADRAGGLRARLRDALAGLPFAGRWARGAAGRTTAGNDTSRRASIRPSWRRWRSGAGSSWRF